ncbi:MAG: hypothetical protein KBT27_05085 [Prevotellaceae bacterium]|nr:hypothetical protein [Candidatus Faecinaster equi]
MGECIVYLSDIFLNGDGRLSAFVDFRTEKDVALFKAYSNSYAEFNNERSVIFLDSFSSSKRLFHDCYYKLNLGLLNQYQFSDEQELGLIGRLYFLHDMPYPNDDDSELLQSHVQLDPSEMLAEGGNAIINLPQFSNEDLSVTVRNVDQANWNELLKGEKVIFSYDLGARKYATAAEVRKLFDFRRKKYENDKPILVLSHWDIDHYHCLVWMSEEEISKCFSKFICVNKIVSVASKRTYDKVLRALGSSNVCCLIPPMHTDGIKMHLWKIFGCISFYQGEISRNRNYCGLSMFVRGAARSVNLTGDLKLKQANDSYDEEKKIGIYTYEHILIAPHHGGYNSPKYRIYSNPTTEIFISVGYKNKYGHPESTMYKYLDNLCRGNVKRTDYCGEIVKSLG